MTSIGRTVRNKLEKVEDKDTKEGGVSPIKYVNILFDKNGDVK